MEDEEHAEDQARGTQAVVPFHLLAEKGVCRGWSTDFGSGVVAFFATSWPS